MELKKEHQELTESLCLRRLYSIEKEVARLRDENVALRRCLEKRGGPGWPDTLAAEVHRVRFEKLWAADGVSATAGIEDVLSGAAGPILEFVGSRRVLFRTAPFVRTAVANVPRLPLEGMMIYAVGGNADPGENAERALNIVERYDQHNRAVRSSG